MPVRPPVDGEGKQQVDSPPRGADEGGGRAQQADGESLQGDRHRRRAHTELVRQEEGHGGQGDHPTVEVEAGLLILLRKNRNNCDFWLSFSDDIRKFLAEKLVLFQLS